MTGQLPITSLLAIANDQNVPLPSREALKLYGYADTQRAQIPGHLWNVPTLEEVESSGARSARTHVHPAATLAATGGGKRQRMRAGGGGGSDAVAEHFKLLDDGGSGQQQQQQQQQQLPVFPPEASSVSEHTVHLLAQDLVEFSHRFKQTVSLLSSTGGLDRACRMISAEQAATVMSAGIDPSVTQMLSVLMRRPDRDEIHGIVRANEDMERHRLNLEEHEREMERKRAAAAEDACPPPDAPDAEEGLAGLHPGLISSPSGKAAPPPVAPAVSAPRAATRHRPTPHDEVGHMEVLGGVRVVELRA